MTPVTLRVGTFARSSKCGFTGARPWPEVRRGGSFVGTANCVVGLPAGCSGYLLLVPICYWLGWRFPLAEALLSAVAALVIGYYGWRWSTVVADYLMTRRR